VRWIITLLVLLLIMGAQSEAKAKGSWRMEQCRYVNVDGGKGSGWSPQEIAATIRCAVQHWAVSGGEGEALSVASCESGLNEKAYNPGGYAGVYQHAVRYWGSRFNSLKPTWWSLRRSVFNGRSNVVIAIRYASRYGWGAWSCA
jgi:hypothetical protein